MIKTLRSILLFFVLFQSCLKGFGQTAVPMASQTNLTYTETFADIANWTNNFAAGVGANRFKAVAANATGTIPDGVKITTASSTFSSSTSGGVQKGTQNIQLLSTGPTDNSSSVAFDFLVDYTGVNAGKLSFDWATVFNSTGDRKGSLRVYTSTNGTAFTELTAAAVLNFTNNVAVSGSVTDVQLPTSFNGAATAVIRFYYYNGTGGTTGSRPKVSVDNLKVTSVAAAAPVISSALTATSFYGTVSNDYTVAASNSPTSYGATNLPPGLTLNTTTGAITGTPTTLAGSPYSVTITATNGSGTDTKTLIYTISQKSLTITGLTANNKTYDGNANATLVGTAALTGVYNTDAVTLGGTPSATFSDATVANNKAVTVTGYTISGAASGNYTLTQPTGLTANITSAMAANQTITFGALSAATYGSNSFTLTATASSGLTVSYVSSNTAVATVSGNTVTIVAPGTTVITASQAGNANYNTAPTVDQSLVVNTKNLTISGLTAASRTYNGTNVATLNGTATLTGKIGTDDVALAGTPTATFSDANVGTAKAVTVTGYTLSGTTAARYNLIQPAGLTADILAPVSTPVIISQYYEGTSTNKWIELTNLSGSPVNTTSPQLKLALYNISGDAGNINITGTPSQTVNLNFTIPAYGSVLLANTGNGAEVPYITVASAKQTDNSVINFNGNDGIALVDNYNTVIDAFGQGINAKDVSYVRNQSVSGTSATFNINDWTLTPITDVQNAADLDDPIRLGVHLQPNYPACVAPPAQATTLVFSNITANSVTANFTLATADEYLVVRSLNNTLSANPSDGTAYAPGDAIGGGIVINRLVSGAFTDNTLASGTKYYYYIFALNNTQCTGGPKYLITTPLTGNITSMTLPACVTPASQASNFTVTSFNSSTIQASYTAASGADQYLVVMSTSPALLASPADGTTYNVGDQLGGGTVIKRSAGATLSRSGLTQNTNYYFFIFSVNSLCTGGPLYLRNNPLTGNQKTAIFNPAALNFYFGNLHGHSSYSDGNKEDLTKTPVDDYAFAKNSMNMDFLGISEHNHTQAGMHLASWQPGIDAAKAATTEKFVAMHGMEWGVISGGGHVVVYGIDSLIGWEAGEYQIFVPKSTYVGTTGLFNIINRHGLNAIATLAHPNTTDFNNLAATYDIHADSAVVGSALESGPAFSTNTTYSDPASSMSYLSYYNKMLAAGYHLGATVDHDNHYLTFGRHTRARLVVLAPSLTENDLLDGMKKMRFYASEDSAARITYNINSQPIGSIVTAQGVPNITVTSATTSPVNSIKLMAGVPGSGTTAVVRATGTSGTFSFSDNTLSNLATDYYYLDITETDGSRIITSPIWYTRNDSFKNNQQITLAATAVAAYGDADVDPAGASNNTTIPITYTSGDPSIATIVNGKIHLLKTGTVTILANQAGNGQFNPATQQQQLLTINPKAITVTADAKTKTYGSIDPLLTYQVTTGALVNSDSFTGSITRTAGESAGTYAVTKGDLMLSTNYALTFIGSNFSITPKPITVAADAKTKTYGDADPVLTYTTNTPLVNGDAFTGTLARTAGQAVGSYNINQGTLALNANYILTYTAANFNITAKPISVTADTKTKTYGDADPALTYTTNTPLINGDTFTGTLTRTTGQSVGSYNISQGTLALNANYILTYNAANFNITTKPVSVTADAKIKTYGDADPALTYTTNTALVNGDAFSGALSRVTGQATGSYAINQGTLSLNTNYTISYNAANLTIGQRPVTIGADAKSKAFGATDPVLTYQLTAGTLVNGDSFSGTLIRDAGEQAGNYAIRQGTLGLNSNYALSYTGANFLINPVLRTITFPPLSVKTYGDADFSIGATISSKEVPVYTSSNPAVATIINGNIHIIGAGLTIIVATAPVNTSFNNTLPVSQTLIVDKAPQNIIFPAIPQLTKGASYSLSNVNSSVGGLVTFTTISSAVAAVTGNRLNAVGIGETTVIADAAGTSNYYAAQTVVQNVKVVSNDPQNPVIVHEALSPNGDGINDTFQLEGISEHPKNSVSIYNRAGILIYQTYNYDNLNNAFDGHSNYTGALQQAGTYYYVLEYQDNGQKTRKIGTLVIKF